MNTKIKIKPVERFLKPGDSILLGILFGVTVILTLILHPQILAPKYSYKIGDIAQRDIKAQNDFLVEDIEATMVSRKKVIDDILTVYDYKTLLAADISQNINKAFSFERAIIREYNNNKEKTPLNEQILKVKDKFEKQLGIPVSDGAYKILTKENFSRTIETLLIKIVDVILSNGVVADKEVLLSEKNGITLRDINNRSEQIVTSLKRFYGPDQAKTMVRIVGEPILKDTDYTITGLVVDFAQQLIEPNIIINKKKTEERKKIAAETIKPFLFEIKSGEMLLREGERVTPLHLKKLSAMQNQEEEAGDFSRKIGAAMIIFSLLLVMYSLYIRNHRITKQYRSKNLLFIACSLVAFLVLVRISAALAEALIAGSPFSIPKNSIYFGIPLAAGSMTVCLFMGLEIASLFAIVMAVCASLLLNGRIDIFIYFLLNSVVAAFWMRHCRERIVFIKSGLKLGLVNMLLVTAVDIYMADTSGIKLLWDWTFAFLGGVSAGIVTAGLAPLVESAFDYTTDIKLLELVNLNKPILRRLMIEASGTYHHSVIVGSMVEAAASAINANPLLARVCGYYHDIGKINKPQYFVENQRDGINKHNKLAPSMSSLILISHIKEGVEIAKENKLGKPIIDTIRQHHGTSLISYFYNKARQLKGEDTIDIDNFRYPGPKPQTKEAGLVMLADVIEAASRTLNNPTTSRIQGLVQNLINKVFSDGQLDHCELTLKDLNNIAKSYIKILSGIYHNRIEYPESSDPAAGKNRNGSTDKKQSRPDNSFNEEDPEKSTGHLRRLGQS